MTPDITIRPTIEEDLPAIRDILNDVICNYDYYLSNRLKSMDDIKLWFDEHQNHLPYVIFTALINNELAGWVSLSPFRPADGYNSTAELSIYVNPLHYRKGIGHRLMNYIECYAREKLHCIISVITSNNEVSILLHKKHGFKIEGIFKEIGNKNGHYSDVVMMTKLI